MGLKDRGHAVEPALAPTRERAKQDRLRRDGAIDRSALPAAILESAEQTPGFGWGRSSLHDYLDQIEESLLKDALGKSRGNKRDAAALLKIPLPTLKSKLAKFHLGKPDEGDLGENNSLSSAG
jgi:transcriptional regulator with PAS, ATPase and Fis domain